MFPMFPTCMYVFPMYVDGSLSRRLRWTVGAGGGDQELEGAVCGSEIDFDLR